MTSNTEQLNPPDREQRQRAIQKRMLQVILQWLVFSAILFVFAGTLMWPAAWALIGVQAAVLLINSLYVLPRNPEGVAERAEIKTDTKGWDRLVTSLLAIVSLSLLVVSGLDYRFGWSLPIGIWLHILGLVSFALGNLLFSWALASNKFFATTVRIQDERDHRVASEGPYSYVRHPGYVGYILFSLVTPVALGTLWGLIPAALIAFGMIVRTALEDRTLQEELPGYKGYAARVRYRLLPGVW